MSRKLFVVLLVFGRILGVQAANAADPAIHADSRVPGDFELQGFIDGRIKAGDQKVVVPPGRYRVTPKQSRHLYFKNLANVEIIADGVEMVCTKTTQAVVFDDCKNVHFKGMTVDYDPLPFTEARITALAPDKSWVEFEIITGYPDNKLAERIEIYDAVTGELRRTDAGWSKNFESIGEHRYRIAKHSGYRFDKKWDTEQVGDILVTINQFPDNAGGHAISLNRCTGVRLEDVTLYSSPCFGFIEFQCDDCTYQRCKIDRRSPENDPVKRGFARMRSLIADAFHSVEAAKGPQIVECTAKFMGDDAVNIHGSYHMVTACKGEQLRVAVTGRITIQAGDPVEFLPYQGARPEDARALKVEPDPVPLDSEEKTFIEKLNLNADIKERLLSGKSTFFKVTLDRPVELAMGSAVCSGNRVGNGFAVKGCDFGFNRSRGILIKASRGEVTGNTITHGWMAAILIAPEHWWMESSSANDVKIEGNRIIGCRSPAIEVIAPGGNGKPLASGAHRNITIASNSITDSVWPNIRVTSTSELKIRGNQLTPADPQDLVPPLAHRWNWGNMPPSAIVTESCDRAEIEK